MHAVFGVHQQFAATAHDVDEFVVHREREVGVRFGSPSHIARGDVDLRDPGVIARNVDTVFRCDRHVIEEAADVGLPLVAGQAGRTAGQIDGHDLTIGQGHEAEQRVFGVSERPHQRSRGGIVERAGHFRSSGELRHGQKVLAGFGDPDTRRRDLRHRLNQHRIGGDFLLRAHDPSQARFDGLGPEVGQFVGAGHRRGEHRDGRGILVVGQVIRVQFVRLPHRLQH